MRKGDGEGSLGVSLDVKEALGAFERGAILSKAPMDVLQLYRIVGVCIYSSIAFQHHVKL